MSRLSLLIGALLLLVGPASGQEATEAPAQVPARTPPPTFHETIAPIVYARCAQCHREDQAAPFSLLTYADVRKRGRTIARVTKSRYMPPWHPVPGHGDFEDATRLTDEEVATLAAWVDGGMPEGDPAKAPARPEFPTGWMLGEPDLVVTMPEGFEVPAGGPDIYRNFVIPLGLDEDRYMTAVEVRPSARTVLHHIIFSFDDSGRARARDGEDGKPGWSGMGGGRGETEASTSGLGGWAVGGQPRHLPMGLARRLPKGADFILRSHFHPSGKKEIERTTLGLYFAEEPPTRTMIGLQLPPGFGVAAGLDIPPGQADFELRDSYVLPVDALAVTVGGHAHYICRDMHVTARLPGADEKRSIFWIDDWAFNWQNRYQYRAPVSLPKGTEIEVVLRYDNSDTNPNNPFDPPQRIRWGLQSTEEMGSVTLLLVAADEADAPTLGRDIRAHARRSLRGDARRYAGMIISQLKMLDANGDGLIAGDEIPARMKRFAARYDTNGDGAIDADEIEAGVERFDRRRDGE